MCGWHGVGKFLPVLFYLLSTLFWSGFAIEDIAGSFGSHHGNLSSGVCEVHVCPDALGVHHDISTSVGFTGDERDFRHRRLGKGIDNLGSVPDDAVVLLLHTRQETWYILDGDEGDVEAVTEADETGSLVGSINIEGSSQEVGLVGYETDGTSCHTSETYDNILCKFRLNFEEVLLVADWLDDIADVIGNIGIGWHHCIKFMTDAVHLVSDRMYGGVFHVVGGNEPNEFTDGHEGLFIVVADEVAHTAHRVVSHGTTEGFLVHILVGHSLNHVGTRYKHLALLFHHQDEVGESRAIAGTTSTRPENGTDLGNDARCHHISPEDVGKTSEGLHTLLDAGTTRIIQSDDRGTVLQCQILHLGYLLGIGCRERTTQHGKVEGIDKDDTPVNLTITRDDAIAFDAFLLHAKVGATMHHMLVHFHKSATVKQRFYSFSCCKFHHF